MRRYVKVKPRHQKTYEKMRSNYRKKGVPLIDDVNYIRVLGIKKNWMALEANWNGALHPLQNKCTWIDPEIEEEGVDGSLSKRLHWFQSQDFEEVGQVETNQQALFAMNEGDPFDV